jgi:hypothetical protein
MVLDQLLVSGVGGRLSGDYRWTGALFGWGVGLLEFRKAILGARSLFKEEDLIPG